MQVQQHEAAGIIIQRYSQAKTGNQFSWPFIAVTQTARQLCPIRCAFPPDQGMPPTLPFANASAKRSANKKIANAIATSAPVHSGLSVPVCVRGTHGVSVSRPRRIGDIRIPWDVEVGGKALCVSTTGLSLKRFGLTHRTSFVEDPTRVASPSPTK